MSKFKIILFFIVLYTYMFAGGLLEIVSASKGFSAYLFFCCDFVLIVLGLMFINETKNRFIFGLFLIFIVTSTLTYAVNSNASLIQHLNGMREYLIIFSAYSFTKIVFETEYSDLFLNKFYGFIKPFLIIQIPVTIFQFIRHGATDWVGGTFGAKGTGVLTITIFLLCFFLIWFHNNCQLFDKFNYRINLGILPLFFPILINETKISLVFIPLFFLFQLRLTKKALVANLILLIFAIAVFSIYDHYVASGATSDVVFEKDYSERYLMKDYEEGDVDIARFTKISLAMKRLSQDSLIMFFGNGIGIFKGGKLLERSEVSVKLLWLLAGSRPYLFFLMMQGGIINTLIMLVLLFYPLMKSSTIGHITNGKAGYFKNLRYFLSATLIVILFYNDSLRNGAVVMIISSISMIIYKHKIYHNLDVTHQEMKFKSI